MWPPRQLLKLGGQGRVNVPEIDAVLFPLGVWMDIHTWHVESPHSLYSRQHILYIVGNIRPNPRSNKQKKQEQQSLLMHPDQNDAVTEVLLQET